MRSFDKLIVLLTALVLSFSFAACEEKAAEDKKEEKAEGAEGEKEGDKGEGEKAEGEAEAEKGEAEGEPAEGDGAEPAAETDSGDTAAAEGDSGAADGGEGAETGGASMADGETLTITLVPPAVNSQRVKTKVQTGEMNINTGDQKMVMTSVENETRTEVVLAVGDEGPSKVKVTLEETKVETMAGQDRPQSAPFNGKTYIVDNSGEATVVTYEDGSAPSQEEVAAVAKKYRNLGKRNPLEAAAVGKELVVGSDVEVDWEAAGKYMAEGDETMKLENGSMRLASVVDGVATFEMKIKLSGEPRPGLAMVTEPAGTVKIDISNGQELEVTLGGPIDMKGEAKPGVPLTANGTMKSVETFVYTK